MQCFISPALYGRKVGIIGSVGYSVRKGLNKLTDEEILAFLLTTYNAHKKMKNVPALFLFKKFYEFIHHFIDIS